MCYDELKPQDVHSSSPITSCVISATLFHLAALQSASLVTPPSRCGVSWGLNDINLAQPSRNMAFFSPHSPFCFLMNNHLKNILFSLRAAFSLFFIAKRNLGLKMMDVQTAQFPINSKMCVSEK